MSHWFTNINMNVLNSSKIWTKVLKYWNVMINLKLNKKMKKNILVNEFVENDLIKHDTKQ